MEDIVWENTVKAFSEESRAAARFRAFSLQAKKDKRNELARLFEALSQAKAIQARRFLGHLKGKIGSTNVNLHEAIKTEENKLAELYPEMVEAAEDAPWAVKKAFNQTMRVASEHIDLLKKASLGDLGETLYVCRICGYISEGHVPSNCPVCHAVKGRFSEV